MTDFVHLHCHSEHSLLDGMSTPLEIAKIASTNGQYAAAITDHGTMGGVLKFQDACEKMNVKPLFGIEAYFVPSVRTDSDSKAERFHLILLAKNNEGLQKLFRASQVSWRDNFYYKPRLDFQLLEDLVDNDIIALSGCMGGAISKAIMANDFSYAERLSSKFIEIFKDDFYYEVQAWNPTQLNDGLIDLAQSFGKKVVATADCHFPNHHDRHDEEMLLMISQYPSLNTMEIRQAKEKMGATGSLTDKINAMYPNRFLRFDEINPYVAKAEEVLSWFKDKGYDRADFLENTIEVADKCTAKITKRNNLLPKFSKVLDSDAYLKEIAHFALSERGLGEEYKERLDEELSVISQMGFADYFLIVWDLIKWADNNNVGRGTGRGSVGGSLLAYLLDISLVDPIKYKLIFSRFLNVDRNGYPDIDLDFEDKQRDRIKQYMIERWGKDNVAAIAIYGEFKAKSVVKDISRVLQVPYEEINNITPFFETLEELQETDKGKNFLTKYPEVLSTAKKLEGRIRTTGIHPAGMVVSSLPLADICPVETRKGTDGGERTLVTAFNMEDAENVGLIKIDVLGLKAVSIIKDCINKIKELHGIDVTQQSLTLDDDEVFRNFSLNNTVGVFQVDAAAYRNLIERMGIDNFNDLVASNALVRPGALLAQGRRYIDCKLGKAKPVYPHPIVEEILKETYGTVIYQEQLMQMAVLLANFTWSEADKLRKVIGKKRDAKEFDPFKEKFVNNPHITKQAAEKIWTEFELAALYMFNKSHAVAYSMMSYQTMWLKVHYPAEFVWALLYNEDAQDKITSYLMEAQRIGIEILPPDVNESSDLFTIKDNSIRFGIKNISGCGDGAIEEIVRNRPYRSFEEFNNKCSRKFVNSRVRENLEKVGAFKSTGHISQYDHEKYYLPILGFALSTNTTSNDIDEIVQTLDGFSENDSYFRFIKVIIRSTKKTPKYLRVEMEDESGSATIFSDRNAEIANRDFIYALIGDRTMHMHCNVYSYEESDMQKFIQMMKSERDHEYAWIYEHGLGSASDDKSLIYIFSERNFVTSTGKTMGSMYAWDGQSLIKVALFPALYGKIARFYKGPGWYAAKLEPLKKQSPTCEFKTYTFSNDNSLLDVQSYIERRKLTVPVGV